MKIIDAIWEKRNLGVSCAEIVVDRSDPAASVKKILEESRHEYIVVKVPAGHTDVMFALPPLGFDFVEASIHITRDVNSLTLSGLAKRLADSVTYEPMEDSDLAGLWDEMRAGMHETDRVALDPYFTGEQAANRYIGWIQDALARGTELYKLVYKNNPIGYFTMMGLGNGVYYPFLAGMYRSYRASGLGFNVAYKPLCEVAARGGTSISTYISTNNDSAVRVHASLGFRFEEIAYVYVKHSRPEAACC